MMPSHVESLSGTVALGSMLRSESPVLSSTRCLGKPDRVCEAVCDRVRVCVDDQLREGVCEAVTVCV